MTANLANNPPRRKVLFLCGANLDKQSLGGTEIVAIGLARNLIDRGFSAALAFHGDFDDDVRVTEVAGVRAYHLPRMPTPTRHEHFSMCTANAPGLRETLKAYRPDIVQIYGLSGGGINRSHLHIAKEFGCKTVLWHNVPGITCLQRELLFESKTPCDGEIRISRCTWCRLRQVGIPRVVAAPVSRVGAGKMAEYLPHRMESLVGARGLAKRHAEAVQDVFETLDAVLIGAHWVRRVLRLNGAAENKMHLIRPGIVLAPSSPREAKAQGIWKYKQSDGRPLRLIYWGRVAPEKGLDTLVNALARVPELSVECAIVGSAPSPSKLFDWLKTCAASDTRISLAGHVDPQQLMQVLRTADIALIPSRWHETGPMTVFEARAAGLPIIGADRGGVGELCRDDPSARLFPAENAQALAVLLKDLSRRPEDIQEMRSQVPMARTMDDVAEQVVTVYGGLLSATPGKGVDCARTVYEESEATIMDDKLDAFDGK